MKRWRCGCLFDEVGGFVAVCVQHKTEIKRGLLNRNKLKQKKYGVNTQSFMDAHGYLRSKKK